MLFFAGQTVNALCPGAAFGTPPENHAPAPVDEEYDLALAAIDLHAVREDLLAVFTDSQECWPADGGHYGPFFVRLAWHCSGSYRQNDGHGGCAGGRQRFEPERSWEDNTNLDKARALLWPIKEKYGAGLSWGDLFIAAGTTAIQSMGGPTLPFCAGRVDDSDGENSLLLGPTPEQEANSPCAVNGTCKEPLGSTTIGLIYLNPEGPVQQREDGSWTPEPDPALSALDIRDTFQRMGMDDSETVALIGGGHAFGKTHGACPAGHGDWDPSNPWPGACGTGMGADTFTSGFEGPWTTNPTQWDNEFFQHLVEHSWEKHMGPGGHWQWRIQNATGPLQGLMRLTSDMGLMADTKYREIVEAWASDSAPFDEAFASAWNKLTTNGGQWSQGRKCYMESVVV